MDTAPLSPAFDMPRPVSGWEGVVPWDSFLAYLCPASISIGFPVWGAGNLLDWDEPAWNGLKNEAHCS